LFFGVAAYSSALLNKHFGLSHWVTIPIGSLASVLVGFIACIPALRLRGFYLGLVTLAFPVILSGIIFIFPDFTGGELGLYGLESLYGSKILQYYIVVLVMLCSVFIMNKLTSGRSKIVRIGVILHAIREDEITARASGIDTTKYKLIAFAISAGFAGIAGGLYAHYIRVAGPSTLDLFFSFQPIIWTIFGGATTIYGAVAGVFILYPLTEIACLNEVAERMRFVGLALILILTPLFMPEGITVWARDKIEVKCQRCKAINISMRRQCRVCRAPLHLEKRDSASS
jgi:branched-chain amino acid transport system permease protein